MYYTRDDLKLIISHPHVETVTVLGNLIGENRQSVVHWKTRGISNNGLSKINNCDHLTGLDFSVKPEKLSDEEIKERCLDFVNRVSKSDILNVFPKEKINTWRNRGRISYAGAILLNQMFDIDFSEMRPDLPKLFWPPKIDEELEKCRYKEIYDDMANY